MALKKDEMTALTGLGDASKFRFQKEEDKKKKDKVRTTLFVDPDLYTELKIAAAKQSKSITELLTEGMQYIVEKYKN